MFLVDVVRRLTRDPNTLEATLAAPTRRRLLELPTRGAAAQVERVPSDAVTADVIARLAGSHKPVVIAGGCGDAPAAGWTPDDMDARFGSYPCFVRSKTVLSREGTPGELLKLAREGRASGLYIDNAADLPANVPGFLADVGVAAMTARMPPNWTYLAAQLFLGGPDTSTGFHCADNTSLFFQVRGRKHWSFVHRGESARMYAYPSTSGIYRHSPVQPEDPLVMQRYPLYAAATRLETTLEPGDILLLPRWWWHEVRNEGELNVGVSTRWGAPAHDLLKDQNLPYAISNRLLTPPALSELGAVGGRAIRDATFRSTFFEGLIDRMTGTPEGRALLPDFTTDVSAGAVDVDGIAAEVSEGEAATVVDWLACLSACEDQNAGSVFRDVPLAFTARHLSRWQPARHTDVRAVVSRFLQGQA